MSDVVIRDSLVLANGKGGVGKTTTAVNLAVEARRENPDPAAEILILDLDAQANAAIDLGVVAHDEGQSLSLSAQGAPGGPKTYPTNRDGIRLIAGGTHLNRLVAVATATPGQTLAEMISVAVAPLITPQTLLFIDTPPATGTPLSDAGLELGDWLLIPTKQDAGSTAGVGTLLERRREIGATVTPVGILMFDVTPTATAVNQSIEEELRADLGGAIPILKTNIRHAVKASIDARAVGLSANEYAQLAANNDIPWYEQINLPASERISFASNAETLAEDWQSLWIELNDRISQLRAAA